MRLRAWKKLDCIFTSRWILLLVCILSLTSRGIIAQNKSFESAFELIEDESTEETVSLPPQEAPLELEDLAVEEKDLTSVEKKDDVKSTVQVLPEVENAFVAKGETGADSLPVQRPSGRMAKEKTAKYVRYGK